MLKKAFTYAIYTIIFSFILPSAVFAATADIEQYTNDTLQLIILISSGATVFYLIKGGYHYFTSTGKPESIIEAKKTIKNALIGLVVVLGAGIIISLFKNALTSSQISKNAAAVSITPISLTTPTGGLTQVLLDAVSGFIQNIVESATKPLVDGILLYLTTTPQLLSNSVIVKFWLVMLGITDSLFVVITALLGLHFMSASTFGFEEESLSKLLPKIGLAFLGANSSLFLADYTIITANSLVKTILDATGGLDHAWIVNAINPATIISTTTPLITLVFLVIFLIVAIVLLFMYISRLIMISLGAVLSPLIFLLWIVPKFSDFAEVAIKSYVVTVFIVFVHVVIIQLASSFLALPENSSNSLVSIAVAIGLFIVLLKTPSFMMQMVFYNAGRGALRTIGSQIINVISSNTSASTTRTMAKQGGVKTPRKVVAA